MSFTRLALLVALLGGGVPADLSVPGADGMDWGIRVYRQPGASIQYCMAVSKGKTRRGRTCVLSAALALRVDAKGIWLDCGLGEVVGEPLPPGPTCGLVRAEAAAVSVGAEGTPPQAAVLSEPFALRVNRSARILRGSGVDPRRVRRLPRPPRVRAFLAFVDGPATPPGQRTPRLTVTVTDPSGPVVRTIGGFEVPEGLDLPPFTKPAPGTKRIRLAGRVHGRLLRTTSWKSQDGSLCDKLRDGRGRPLAALGCWGKRPLRYHLSRHGSVGSIHSGQGARGPCCAAYGFTRGDAVAVEVVAPDGRSWSAKLSPAWATVRLGLKARAFLAMLPVERTFDDDGVEVRTTLGDGRVLTDGH